MTSFGKYDVLGQIGEGGFGKVYRGWDPILKRWVAIKTCSFDDPELRERFVREAELAANLQHPNIVTVHDFGRQDGEPYLVQEYLEGDDLDELIRRGEPAGLEARLDCLRQVAEALRFAHDRGVIHRDVKPANVRVGPDGRVRLMDFGIARLLDAESRLTRTGMSVGTAGYMAPEQLQGLEIDHRADLFSFGVLAYELMAGRPPFEGDSISTLFYQIAHEDPPPVREAAPDCPTRLAAVIERCLRKDREERYDGFEELLRELGALELGSAAGSGEAPGREDAGPGAASESGPHRRDGPAMERSGPFTPGRLAAGGLALVALAALAWLGLAGTPGSGDGEPIARNAPGEATAVDQGAETGAARDAGAEGGATAGDAPASRDEADAYGDGDPEATGTGTGPAGGEASGAEASAGEGGRSESASGSAAVDRSGVLVLVSGDARSTPEAVESVLLTELADEGWTTVDRTGLDLRARAAADAPAPGDLEELRAATTAAVLVLGELRSDARPSVGGFYTGSATLTLRAYRTATGELLASETFRVGGGGTPGELGDTPRSAVASAAEQVAHQAAIGLRRALAERD